MLNVEGSHTIIPGFKPKLPKLVPADPIVIPLTPVADDAVILPGAADEVSGDIVNPVIVIWSICEVPVATMEMVNPVLEKPDEYTIPGPDPADTSPPALLNVGGVPVQNCHPVGGINVIWSVPFAKSLGTVSVMVIVPNVVQGGNGPQRALPPVAGLTTTCAKPVTWIQQKRNAAKYIFKAFLRQGFTVVKAVKIIAENFFIILTKVLAHVQSYYQTNIYTQKDGKHTKKKVTVRKIR